MKATRWVYLLEAQYLYEGSTLIGVYSDETMVNAKANKLRRDQDRWHAVMEEGSAHKIPNAKYIGADITVSKVRVIQPTTKL